MGASFGSGKASHVSEIPDSMPRGGNECYRQIMNTELHHDPLWHRAGDWGTPPESEQADLIIVGVPTWRTSLSKTNAGITPDAIRDALRRYSTHTLAADRDQPTQLELHEQLVIIDAGDIYEPDLEEDSATRQIEELSRLSELIVALGGDNALTVPVARGTAREDITSAGLITLDAHHDLREGRSNGSPIRRLVEQGFDPSRIVQVGIADFANSKPYRDRAQDWGITVIHRDELAMRPVDDIMAEAFEIAGAAGGPIHVDLDVDVCDRSVAPGCPASIPGGISAWELRRVARLAGAHQLVRSIDIAEIDAAADAPDGRTVRLGALLVLEAAAGLAMRLGRVT